MRTTSDAEGVLQRRFAEIVGKQYGRRLWLQLVGILALAGLTQAQVGTTICACSPARYQMQIITAQTCAETTVALSNPGIINVVCMTNPEAIGPPDEITISSVQILELDQNQQLLSSRLISEELTNGSIIEFDSFTADPDAVMSGQVPGSIEIGIMARNSALTNIFHTWTIEYSNSCDVYPVLGDGQQIGWTTFVSKEARYSVTRLRRSDLTLSHDQSMLTPPSGRVCPLAAGPTSAPTDPVPTSTSSPTVEPAGVPTATPRSTKRPTNVPGSTKSPTTIPVAPSPATLSPHCPPGKSKKGKGGKGSKKGKSKKGYHDPFDRLFDYECSPSKKSKKSKSSKYSGKGYVPPGKGYEPPGKGYTPPGKGADPAPVYYPPRLPTKAPSGGGQPAPPSYDDIEPTVSPTNSDPYAPSGDPADDDTDDAMPESIGSGPSKTTAAEQSNETAPTTTSGRPSNAILSGIVVGGALVTVMFATFIMRHRKSRDRTEPLLKTQLSGAATTTSHTTANQTHDDIQSLASRELQQEEQGEYQHHLPVVEESSVASEESSTCSSSLTRPEDFVQAS